MDHHHHEHPHHSQDGGADMSLEEKLVKLLAHWVQHNEEHAQSYELWAEKAASHGIPQVAGLLRSAAEKTRSADNDFKAALADLKH